MLKLHHRLGYRTEHEVNPASQDLRLRATILRKPVMRDLGPIAQTRMEVIQESSGSPPLQVMRRVGNYILAKTS